LRGLVLVVIARGGAPQALVVIASVVLVVIASLVLVVIASDSEAISFSIN